jgi:hypothetical protein
MSEKEPTGASASTASPTKSACSRRCVSSSAARRSGWLSPTAAAIPIRTCPPTSTVSRLGVQTTLTPWDVAAIRFTVAGRTCRRGPRPLSAAHGPLVVFTVGVLACAIDGQQPHGGSLRLIYAANLIKMAVQRGFWRENQGLGPPRRDAALILRISSSTFWSLKSRCCSPMRKTGPRQVSAPLAA